MLLIICTLLSVLTLIVESQYEWYNVSDSDITSKSQTGVSSTYSNINGNLVINATLETVGCGEGPDSHIFAFIADNIDNNSSTQWDKIRYRQDFWGTSQCWSILGNTVKGAFPSDFNSGLLVFDINAGDLIISNNIITGSWNGTNETSERCDGEASNFWDKRYGPGYRGSFIVEQRRNKSAHNAGIGSGHSCTQTWNGPAVSFSDIQVGYLKNDCFWRSMDGNNVLNITSLKGQAFAFNDLSNPNLFYVYNPCQNTMKCGMDNILAMSYLLDVQNVSCVQYLAVWDNGTTQPQYDSIIKQWRFIYSNGQKCDGFDNWNCDQNAITSKVISANQIGTCSNQMTINSSLACN